MTANASNYYKTFKGLIFLVNVKVIRVHYFYKDAIKDHLNKIFNYPLVHKGKA